MFKSTKNGSFEKSTSVLNYKLNHIGFDSDEIIKGCAENIKNNILNGVKSSVFLFGPKSKYYEI